MNQHKLVPLIDLLLTKAQQLKLINPRDLIYLRNHYAILLNLKSLEHSADREFSANLDQQQHSIADLLNNSVSGLFRYFAGTTPYSSF